MTIDMAYRFLYTGALVVLAAFIGLVLIAAAVKKPCQLICERYPYQMLFPSLFLVDVSGGIDYYIGDTVYG